MFLPGEFHGQREEPGGLQPREGQDGVTNRHSEPLRQVVFKRGTDIYFQGHNGETDIKNRPVDMGGGEGKMYVEGNIENYNTICKLESKWGLDV